MTEDDYNDIVDFMDLKDEESFSTGEDGGPKRREMTNDQIEVPFESLSSPPHSPRRSPNRSPND